MWTRFGIAAMTAAFLAGSAGLACAQGSSTQDPGRMTPGNLTFQHLGPSGATSANGTTETSSGTTVFHGAPGGAVTGGATPGSGTSSTGLGTGNPPGFGTSTRYGR